MKAKVSIDLTGVQNFLLKHGEKLAFAVVFVVVVLFIWGAINTSGNTVDFTAQDLQSAVQQATQHIDSTPRGVQTPAEDLTQTARRLRVPIEQTYYRTPTAWNPLLFEKESLRGEPPVFVAEALRATAGQGIFAVRPQPAASGTTATATAAAATATVMKGYRWVVVTGLVPISKQWEAYVETFKKAELKDPQRDQPLYIHYWVERAEVNPRGQVGQVKWQRIDPRLAFYNAARQWRQVSPEVVLPAFIPRYMPGTTPLVFPLGPLVGDRWGEEAAHAPEIPLASAMQSSMGSMASSYEGSYPAMMSGSPYIEEDTDSSMMMSMPGGYPGMMSESGYSGGMGAMGSMMGMPGMPMIPGMGSTMTSAPGAMPSMPGAMPGGGIMPGMPPIEGLPQMPPADTAGAPGAGATQPPGTQPPGTMIPGMPMRPGYTAQQIKHQLFRFFDFDVEAGKRYRYRVKLVLLNPNYKLNPRYVERIEVTESPWLETEWSDPTDPVVVPRDARLVAGPVKAPPAPWYEPSASVVVVALQMDEGVKSVQDFTVSRGQVANLQGKLLPPGSAPGGAPTAAPYGSSMMASAMMSSTEEPDMPMASMYPAMTTRPGQQPQEDKPFLYQTEMLVLDIDGGRRLHRTDTALLEPGRLLLLDPEGNLLVREELADETEYKQYHREEDVTKPKKKPKVPEGYSPEDYSEYMEEGMSTEEMEYMQYYGGRGRDSRTRRARGR